MAETTGTQGRGTARSRAASEEGTIAKRGRRKAAGDASGIAAGGSTVEAPRGSGRGGERGRRAAGTAGGAGGSDLRSDLREFTSSHPDGWPHDDWAGLLSRLGERGHDVSDPDRVGMSLERERLASLLERVRGMGASRVQAVVDRYQTLWSFRQTSVEDVASVPGMNRALAERAKQSVG